MKLNYRSFLVLIAILLVKIVDINLNHQCFSPQGGDSRTFGFSLAMGNDYLAVGDPDANQVVIYSQNKFNLWNRTKKIMPPVDSTTHRVGSGFGYSLAINEDTLVIGAYGQKKNPENPEDFQLNGSSIHRSGAVYQTNLAQDSIVKRLDKFKQGEIVGTVVAADEGKVVFSSSKIEPDRPWNGVNKIVVLSDGQRKYLSPPTDKFSRFAGDFALHDDLLLVGSINDDQYKAWLFDLENSPHTVPQSISIDPNLLVGTSVAVNQQFLVIGERVGHRYSESAQTLKTIIRRIDDDSEMEMDGYGEVSLDNNILSRLRFRRPFIREANILELFYLDNNATPRRILKRKNITKALVHNSLLTTVQKNKSKAKLCIEPISFR